MHVAKAREEKQHNHPLEPVPPHEQSLFRARHSTGAAPGPASQRLLTSREQGVSAPCPSWLSSDSSAAVPRCSSRSVQLLRELSLGTHETPARGLDRLFELQHLAPHTRQLLGIPPLPHPSAPDPFSTESPRLKSLRNSRVAPGLSAGRWVFGRGFTEIPPHHLPSETTQAGRRRDRKPN